VAEVDLGALREARHQRLGHNPLAHLRHGVSPDIAVQGLPGGTFSETKDPQGNRTAEQNETAIRAVLEKNPWRTPGK